MSSSSIVSSSGRGVLPPLASAAAAVYSSGVLFGRLMGAWVCDAHECGAFTSQCSCRRPYCRVPDRSVDDLTMAELDEILATTKVEASGTTASSGSNVAIFFSDCYGGGCSLLGGWSNAAFARHIVVSPWPAAHF